jgi:hypothetical protein
MFRKQQTAPQAIYIVLACFCLLLSTQSRALAQQILKPEGQETTIQGTIRLIHGLGPPGYGEDPKHDAHVSYWALEVPIPVNTPCIDSEFGCDPAKRLKLFFPNMALVRLSDLPAAKWKDHAVIVHGKLHHADTAGEMTPIYIDVTSIQDATANRPSSKQ